LTTNRVGTFDEAFTSRIHISLYYPPLSQKSTLAVFKVNLDRIKERFAKKKERGVAELDLDEGSIDIFVHNYFIRNPEARWNGRQIRNACQTALALAEFEAQKRANPGVEEGRTVMELAAAETKMIKVKMTAKHFRDVARAYLAFMKYLREVHGGVSAAQRAKEYRLRNDRWGMVEKQTAVVPVAGSLLASRRAAFAEKKAGGAGVRGRQQQGVQGQRLKQGVVRRTEQQFRLEVEDVGGDEYYGEEEDELGEYGYGEDEGYGQDEGEDTLLYGEEEEEEEEGAQFAEDLDYEQEEVYPEEDEDGGAEFGLLDDGQAVEEDGEDEYAYEEAPKARPQPAGGRGNGARGRGLQRARGPAVRSRAALGGRGRGAVSSIGGGRQHAASESASRGSPAPRTLGPARARASPARGGRVRRVASQV
jgi:hypothetical protein